MIEKRRVLFLLSVIYFLNCTDQQLIASSNYIDQPFSTMLQPFSQSSDLGFLSNYADQMRLNIQRKFAQNLLCARTASRKFLDQHIQVDENDTLHNVDYKEQLRKLYMMLLLILASLPYGVVFGSDNRLSQAGDQDAGVPANMKYKRALVIAEMKIIVENQKKDPEFKVSHNRKLRSDRISCPARNQVVQQQEPLVAAIEERNCCSMISHNIRALPLTYGTNIAGNLVAITVSYFSPNPVAAGLVSGGIGCIGGFLEGCSTDNVYVTDSQHILHNNAFTGYVADQITGSCGSCFMFPIVNAAAIGAPVGYACGVGTGLAVRSCLACQSVRNQAVQLSQVPTEEMMIER